MKIINNKFLYFIMQSVFQVNITSQLVTATAYGFKILNLYLPSVSKKKLLHNVALVEMIFPLYS